MKRIIQIAMPCILLASCQNSCKPASDTNTKCAQQFVWLTLEDCTVSYKNIQYLNEDVATNLYNKIALSGGGVIKHINILDEQTANQNVYSMEVGKLDTISLDGVSNVYNRTKFSNQNIDIKARFTKDAHEKIAKYIAATTLPRKYKYTYLQSALELARLTLEQPIYSKGYNRYLLICSDMKNSIRGKKHNVPLKPIDLPNTTVLIVRPALFDVKEAELRSIFPQSEVFVFTDVNDAISMVNNINH